MDQQVLRIGYAWLIETFSLTTLPLTHASYIGVRALADTSRPGLVREFFPPSYWPGDDPFDHLVFALKYDDFNLDVLDQTLAALGADRVLAYVESQPNGKYARQLGYLFELFSGQQLALRSTIGGAYIDLLDPEKYVVAAVAERSTRWHINDNLLGSPRFCPVVRRIPELQALMHVDVKARLQVFRQQVEPALFQRAIDYLYFKETRSSFDIERETPTPDREQRFVSALREAGKATFAEALSESSLVNLQNLIVDPRYAQRAFRITQNYVGESMPGRAPVIHYVCPPGHMVENLMAGLLDCAERTQGLHSVVRAALVSFGFVFIHPFEDGNGRIHRFLIHDFLGRDGVVPDGMVLPVSAYILHHPREYDRVLEVYSKALRSVVNFSLDDDEQLTINNPGAASGAYRYPDLTLQALYLLQAVEQTIHTELATEIAFIRSYDAARAAIALVLDMPDARIDLIIKLLYQNRGALARGKRALFQEVTDAELRRIELVFKEAFGGAEPGGDSLLTS